LLVPLLAIGVIYLLFGAGMAVVKAPAGAGH